MTKAWSILCVPFLAMNALALTAHYEDGPVGLDLAVSQTNLTTVERIKVSWSVTAPMAFEVSLIEPDFKAWTVSRRTMPQKALLPDGIVKTESGFFLEPFLPGDYVIPSLEFEYRSNRDDPPIQLKSKPIPVQVASVLVEADAESKLLPMQADVSVPMRHKQIVVWAGIVLGLIWWRWMRRRRDKNAVAETPSPAAVALYRLDELLGRFSPATLPFGSLANIVSEYLPHTAEPKSLADLMWALEYHEFSKAEADPEQKTSLVEQVRKRIGEDA